MPEPQQLRQSVRQALAFYDMFSYPLTPKEVLNAANVRSVHAGDVMGILETDSSCSKRNGYYCLKGREGSVATRHERYLLAERKHMKVRWFLKVLSAVPYVRLICICNTLSYANSREDSDIDLFIVAKEGRAHFCRMMCGFLAAVFGLRPQEGRHRDKVCLSFFVDEASLNLGSLSLGEDDAYFHHWLMHLAPVYDQGGFFAKFMKENSWVRAYLPNFVSKEEYCRAIRHGRFLRALKRTLEAAAEAFLREPFQKMLLQKEERRFPAQIKEMRNLDTRVVITDGILKFHPNDRRAEYAQKLQERMRELATANA